MRNDDDPSKFPEGQNREMLRGWHLVARRLEEALALLDRMEEGDSQCAADVQAALLTSLKHIRTQDRETDGTEATPSATILHWPQREFGGRNS